MPGVDGKISDETAFIDDYLYDITVGEMITKTRESFDDLDLFGIELEAGQSIQIDMTAITMDDPYLILYDSDGNFLTFNDDASFGTFDSTLYFTADTAGTYYIEASSYYFLDSFDPDLGTYNLSVSEFIPPYAAEFEDSPNLNGPLDAVNWGTMLSDPEVTVYFAPAGYMAGGGGGNSPRN